MSGTIRPLIDGGCSMCKSDEEHIGKGRCRHVSAEQATVRVTDSGVAVDKSGFPVCTTNIEMQKMDRRTMTGKIDKTLTNEEIEVAKDAMKSMPKTKFTIDEE